jgi:hypothetical protein
MQRQDGLVNYILMCRVVYTYVLFISHNIVVCADSCFALTHPKQELILIFILLHSLQLGGRLETLTFRSLYMIL